MATVYNINIKKLDEKAVIPTYGSEYAAGADLYACLDEAITIEPGQTVMVHTGIAMEIPEGFAGLVYARSGLASKKGLAPANKVGVVDADYREEGRSWLHSTITELQAQTVEPEERIAQLVIAPYIVGAFHQGGRAQRYSQRSRRIRFNRKVTKKRPGIDHFNGVPDRFSFI